MLKPMRSVYLLACLGLMLGCSSADDDDPNGVVGGASQGGSTSTAGNTSHAGDTNQPDAGRSNGGTSSTAGSTGKAGSAAAGTTSTGGTANGNDPYGDARKRCVDRTNELRATKGKGPIPRLATAEPCADGQAKSDSESGKAHGAFNACANQVKGWSAIAQDECPGYGSVEDALTKCLDMMWAEGPGGGHYDNMMSDSTDTACGFYTTPAGKVWMVQDFWTK
jgi:hypothetical protein